MVMYFQQFEDLKIIFFLGENASGPLKTLAEVQRSDLGGNVSILLENPESCLDFSRETSIPIWNISSHKPTSREIYFC